MSRARRAPTAGSIAVELRVRVDLDSSRFSRCPATTVWGIRSPTGGIKHVAATLARPYDFKEIMAADHDLLPASNKLV